MRVGCTWRTSPRRLVAASLGCLVAAGCGQEPLASARESAQDYFASEVHELDHGWAPIFDYLHRRFGIELQLASGRSAHGARDGLRRPELALVYRRLVDGRARVRPQQIEQLESPIDRITATALYCDQVGLPSDWIQVLRRASLAGAYALTHAVVAAQWTLENDCLSGIALAKLQLEQTLLLEDLLQDRTALDARHELSLDIWIEALAMLYYSGAGERVRPEWIDALLATQRDDGGWPNHPDRERSAPHPTALALWVLLENLEPDAPRTAWIPQ